MKSSNLWNSLKNIVYKHYGQESGKLLVHAGLITWTTACLSQVVAIILNDKMPKEQKKFLIPQELADGAVNIMSFYLITNSMKNIGSKLASTGKWSTKSIRNFVEKNPLTNNLKMGDIELNLGQMFKENEEFHQAYDNFKGGMEMISAVTGAVISSNLVTPFVRNAWAAKRQKQVLAKEGAGVGMNIYQKSVYPKNSGMKI